MVLIRLMGGLGNQMFQYAFGKRMSLAANTELVLDQSLLLDRSQPHELVTHRNFDLDIFNLKDYRWATKEEVFAYNGDVNASVIKKAVRKIKNTIVPKQLIIQQANEFNPQYLNIKPDVCFVGRWQSELYFKDAAKAVREEFTFSTPFNQETEKYKAIISDCNSVCLHVRRGDLVTSAVYSASIGALNRIYYDNALTYIRERIEAPVFFVFSDDVEWCKQNIILAEQTYYMDDATAGSKAEGHLYLMQQCKHFIISNSTYAWWAAWLAQNDHKQVVYPLNWYKDVKSANPNMCPAEWKCL
jgi:hypothetical protein